MTYEKIIARTIAYLHFLKEKLKVRKFIVKMLQCVWKKGTTDKGYKSSDRNS